MGKRKIPPTPSSAWSGAHHSNSRPRQRRRTNSTPVYRVNARSLPPIPGAREFGEASTARFNDSLAADILGGMVTNSISGYTGIPKPLVAGGVTLARNILSDLAQPTEFSKTNMNSGQTKAKKALVQRSSMTVTGRTKVKRTKKVHLSKKFITGVKQVLAGSAATGSYVTIKCGMVGSLVGPGVGGALTGRDLGTAAANLILYPGATESSGCRTLFNALSNWSTSVNSTVVADTPLNFFTPAKIIDAASVLFNAKALGDPYSGVGNLSQTFVGGTAVTLPAIPALKINVLGSSVDFELKNISNRVVSMDIWECTPTVKFQLSNPLQVVEAATTHFMNTANNNNILYFQSQPGVTSTLLYHEQAVDPLEVLKRYAGLPMSWKKRSMVLAPDETCIHSIQGPKGVLDYSKLVLTDKSAPAALQATQLNCMLKGWSVGCIISVNGDQVLAPTLAVNRGDKAAYADNVNIRMGMPVAVQIREFYKVAVPEIAGFVSTGGAVGTSQLLNLRKPKCVIWNQIVANGVTSTAPIQVSNEQQPMSDLVGGQTA